MQNADAFAASLAQLDTLAPSTENAAISGRSAPANVAPVRAPARELDLSDRLAVVTAALPELERRPLRAVAGALGIAASTLRAWCMAYDGPAYEAALRAHVGAQLADYAAELDEAGRMARVAASLTVRNRKTVTSDGDKSTGYTLTGPVLMAAARARASVAAEGAKFWQWIGERRLTRTFGESEAKAPTGAGRASFLFIVDGRKREIGASSPAGRTLEHEPAA